MFKIEKLSEIHALSDVIFPSSEGTSSDSFMVKHVSYFTKVISSARINTLISVIIISITINQ